MSRRVHVVGRGAVTPFGDGAATLCDAIFAGRSAIAPRRRLADVDCLTAVAAEMPATEAAETELPFLMAVRAASEACPDRGGVALVLATTKGDLSGVTGPGDGLGNPHRLAQRLATALQITGPVAAVSCACASGIAALALGARWIRSERADRVLVVGTDALCAFIVRGFSSLLALAPGVCRPFDKERDGLNLGEAAGALLLATGGDGVELAGWGEANDANHITGPSRDGAGLHHAAATALRRAGVDGVDFVHVHGTGTPYNDAMEGEALKRIFDGTTPPVSGTKAQTGHTLGAAGIIESIITIEALQRGIAPANLRLRESDLDPRVTLPREPHPLRDTRVALKLAAGFGGIDTALVFKR